MLLTGEMDSVAPTPVEAEKHPVRGELLFSMLRM